MILKPENEKTVLRVQNIINSLNLLNISSQKKDAVISCRLQEPLGANQSGISVDFYSAPTPFPFPGQRHNTSVSKYRRAAVNWNSYFDQTKKYLI